jgi:hypothetical protein
MKSVFIARQAKQHQAWMGALVGQTTVRHPPRPDSFDAPARTGLLASARGERLTDIVLAVVYVAGCAVMGWAGAAWL